MAIDFCIDCNSEFENPSYVGGCCPSCHNKRHPEETKSVLKEAEELVNGARQEKYGDFVECMTRTAEVFSAISGIKIEPKHVPMFNLAQKLVRERNVSQRENRVDMAGYIEGWNRVEESNVKTV